LNAAKMQNDPSFVKKNERRENAAQNRNKKLKNKCNLFEFFPRRFFLYSGDNGGGQTQTLDLGIMWRVFHLCATTDAHKKLKNIFLTTFPF
jgi:hypothetical protein